ncbi:MAG: formylglycine-generating enzyme family protein [Phycisphaeraceae bacterium]
MFAGSSRLHRMYAAGTAAAAVLIGVTAVVLFQPSLSAENVAENPDEAVEREEIDGMVWVPGGAYQRGSNEAYPEEGPRHEVSVDGFWMDKHPVTNRQYAAFVEATDYVTVAEKKPEAALFPGAAEEDLVPGSVVFVQPEQDVNLRGHVGQWWQWVPGAYWRAPEGPGSSIADRMDHPVVHVAYEDAKAYADWAGKKLPTEAQWERAARGGLEGKMYVWGDEMMPDDQHLANTWQGKFPVENAVEDGHAGTSPVMSFPANGYGLYDMAGNVWEWTSDWFHPQSYRDAAGEHNPVGPAREESFSPSDPGRAVRAMRGGSYLCATSYCLRFRPSARSATTPDTATTHLGFRCIKDPEE